MSSVEGQGSTFTLYLPLMPPTQRAPAPNVAAPPVMNQPEITTLPALADDREQLKPNQPSILIVEDDLNFAKVLIDFVREHGFAALVASDGESGIALATRFVPSAILLDVMLPKKDGWDVMNSLKAICPRATSRYVFVTCMEDRKKAMEMGAVGFVTKPVNQHQLNEVFRTIEGRWRNRPRTC